MRGYICGATSKEFNALTKMRDPKHDCLNFGLSILHEPQSSIFTEILNSRGGSIPEDSLDGNDPTMVNPS